VDGRAYYAAKSAERDGRRLFFGWIATKEGDRDDGPWQWAGTLSVLEARQNPDGTLAFGFSDEMLDRWDTRDLLDDERAFPRSLDARGRHLAVTSEAELPATFRATVRFQVTVDTDDFGVLLRSSADGDTAYSIRLEPRHSRMVFDRWPRRRTGDGQWEVSGDVPHVIELERPCDLSVGEHVLDIIVDEDICVANLDRAVVLSTRIYDLPAGRFGVFASEGTVGINGATVTVPAPVPDLIPALAAATR
jgi:beta-fructofuranosidase